MRSASVPSCLSGPDTYIIGSVKLIPTLKRALGSLLYFPGASNLRSFFFRPYIHAIFPTVLVLITAAFAVGQSTGSGEDAADPLARRLERARTLAAVHQLQAAATELENIRASGNDVTLRNVATLMLLGIYLEDGNYGRSQSLLEDTFNTRAAQKDESIRTYFAAAGQTVNGIRSHLARYRSYGINPSDADLPVEANTDLERVRGLLEKVIAQAQEISKEQGRAYEAFALLEDVLGIRLSLAKNDDDRAKWQTEYLTAREKMASSQAHLSADRRLSMPSLTEFPIPLPPNQLQLHAPEVTAPATTSTAPSPSHNSLVPAC